MAANPSDTPNGDYHASSSSTINFEPTSLPGRPHAPSHDQVSRKRKVPDSVTPNACTNCKKARAKCDGARPACKRCVVRRLPDPCHYGVHVKTAKEDMVREIHRLQKENESLGEQNDSLGEKNDWIEQIMRSLKNDDRGTEIIRRLKRGESHRSIVEWLGRPMTRSTQDLTPSSDSQLVQALEDYHRSLIENHDPCYWTNVTRDRSLIEHLISLYLTWIHPAHMLIDENEFLGSFRDCLDTHCSASLVNAICALSCHLLHHGWDDDDDTKSGIDSLCLQFMDEVRSLMKIADPASMTASQTYAIMFLVELGLGKGQAATSHLRLAVEILAVRQPKFERKHHSDSEEVASWGILSLHTAWSGLTYQKPAVPLSPRVTVFRDIPFDQPDGPWCFYRQPGDVEPSKRPRHALLTAFEHAKLLRVVHETIHTFCRKNGQVEGDEFSRLYDRYLAWMDELPEEIRALDGDIDVLPHVIFLHLQYHTAVINILLPLLEVNDARDEFILGLAIQHAKRGVELLLQYHRIYTAVYQTPLQLFVVVHLCDALVRYDRDSESTSEVIRFCLETLQDARVSYALAGPLQKMFYLAIQEYGIPLSDDISHLTEPLSQYGPEELLEACTRISYKQPVTQLLPNMGPEIAQEFTHIRQHMPDGLVPEAEADHRKTGKQMRMQITSLLNS